MHALVLFQNLVNCLLRQHLKTSVPNPRQQNYDYDTSIRLNSKAELHITFADKSRKMTVNILYFNTVKYSA